MIEKINLSPFSLSSGFHGRPVHVGLAPAVEARQAVASPAPWVRQRGEYHRRIIEGTGRLLVHQVFLRHREQRGVIPRRGLGSPPFKAFFPTTGPAATVKGLHPILKLRQVDRLDRPGTARTPAWDRFMLECTHEPLMRSPPQAGHGASTRFARQKPGIPFMAVHCMPGHARRQGMALRRVHRYPTESLDTRRPTRLSSHGFT